MARPLKYGEKTSVRNVTIPDSMWEALPEPRSQWVVESIRQFLGAPLKAQAEGTSVDGGDVVAQVGRAPRVTGEGRPSVDPVATRGEVGGSNPSPPPSASEEPVVELEAPFEAVQALVDKLPEPIRSEVPDPTCSHPKARQVNVIGGRKCLDCGKVKGVQGTWV